MSWKANWPSLVVTVLWSRPVATSVALTCAFGTTAPDGSLTVPLMAPRNVWALAAIVTLSRTNKTKSRHLILHLFFGSKIHFLLCQPTRTANSQENRYPHHKEPGRLKILQKRYGCTD